MPKTFEILKYFPDFHHAVDRNKLLYHVVDVIATRIQEIENDMIGVMKAHWIDAAEDIDDLEKIAALYGIELEDYEDLEQFRTKIQDIIRLYLAGPGTVPSLFEFVAIALKKYDIEMERDEDGNVEIIRPVNGDEFRSQGRIYFDGKEDYIELYENPKIEKRYGKIAVRHRETWSLKNQGFFGYYPEITIHEHNSRTINPVLFNRSTGHALGFRGIIPENGALIITADQDGYLNLAELDGADVKDRIYCLKGAQLDQSKFNEDESKFAIYKPEWAFNEASFAESFNGNENPPIFNIPVPSIPVRESEWEFRIMKSEFNGSRFNDDAFTFPDRPVGIFDVTCFDESVFLIAPSANIAMKWEEHQRAMFEVIVPCELGTKQIESAPDDEQDSRFIEPLLRVSKLVERVKPAGVKSLVKYRDDGWILGDSVLRSGSVIDSIGINCKSTSLIKLKEEANLNGTDI